MPGRGEGFATPELGGDELLGRQRLEVPRKSIQNC